MGIGISLEMVETATALAAESGITNARFVAMDLLDLGVDNAFDLVISNSSMHWIKPPE